MRDDVWLRLNGRYRIGPLVGEGALGTVSRGWDSVLERDVAIKLLKPAYASDARTVARFYAEARAAARLVHPHAVLVHDVVADGPRHAIVMEYVAGVTLERVLATEGRIPEARAVAYGRQIAQALAAAHASGLLHRDVKPANVLITPEDSVKVADFGLAKAVAAGEPSPSEVGLLIGSASYVSPEQAQGFALTPASDLYSLGVVLYRLVAGRLPFEGESPIAVAVAHVTAPAPSEAELAREMSPALATIVARLLRKQPAQRYASAAEVVEALAAIDTGPRRTVPAWDAPTDIAMNRVRAASASSARTVAAQPARAASDAHARDAEHRSRGDDRARATDRRRRFGARRRRSSRHARGLAPSHAAPRRAYRARRAGTAPRAVHPPPTDAVATVGSDTVETTPGN